MASSDGTMMQQQATAARLRAAESQAPMAVEDKKNEGVKRAVDQVSAEGDVQQRQRAAPAPSTTVAVATAAEAEAAPPLDPISYGVQLGSGAAATSHGSALASQQQPTTPPKPRTSSPKRVRADPDSPEPAPAPHHPVPDVPPTAMPSSGAISQQQVIDELHRMNDQHRETAVWKKAVDSCLANHKQRLVRDRAKIVGLLAGANGVGTGLAKAGSGPAPMGPPPPAQSALRFRGWSVAVGGVSEAPS